MTSISCTRGDIENIEDIELIKYQFDFGYSIKNVIVSHGKRTISLPLRILMVVNFDILGWKYSFL